VVTGRKTCGIATPTRALRTAPWNHGLDGLRAPELAAPAPTNAHARSSPRRFMVGRHAPSSLRVAPATPTTSAQWIANFQKSMALGAPAANLAVPAPRGAKSPRFALLPTVVQSARILCRPRLAMISHAQKIVRSPLLMNGPPVTLVVVEVTQGESGLF